MEQIDLLRRAIDTLETEGIRYLIVGSLASMAYGQPRSTQDIDIVVDAGAAEVTRLCDSFPEGEYYVNPDTARQAARDGGQFNVIHPASGNKIDFIIARRDAWGRQQVERRRRVTIFPGLVGYTGSPEDVILGKLWYYQLGGSEKHLRDIAAMLRVSGDQIDRAYIAQWADQLGLTDIWQAILSRLTADR
jgi:hypothetical protein